MPDQLFHVSGCLAR